MKKNSPFILYDATRIIATMDTSIFTGIDRVDFIYARHVAHTYACMAVAHANGYIHYLDQQEFCKLLADRDKVMHEGQARRYRWVSRSAPAPAPDLASLFTAASWKQRYELLKKTNLNALLPSWLRWLGRLPLALRNLIRLPLAVLLLPLALPLLLAHNKRQKVAPALNPHADARIENNLRCHLGQKLVYVNVSHSLAAPLMQYLAALKTKYGIQTLFYIHDVIPIDFPEYVCAGNDLAHRQRLRTISDFSSTVICNSFYTKERLLALKEFSFFDIVVSHIGHSVRAFAEDKHIDIPARPFFVVLGTIEGRKNHISLFHIWRKMNTEDEAMPLLYVLGRRGWSNGSVIDFLDRSPLMNDSIVEINNASDAVVQTLLRHARALLMPSFSEGWGMPVVEALSLGTPVICSDLPVFHEATQGLATFIDPLDLPQWQRTIRAFQREDSPEHAAMLARIQAFQCPRWEHALHDFDTVLSRNLCHGA